MKAYPLSVFACPRCGNTVGAHPAAAVYCARRALHNGHRQPVLCKVTDQNGLTDVSR